MALRAVKAHWDKVGTVTKAAGAAQALNTALTAQSAVVQLLPRAPPQVLVTAPISCVTSGVTFTTVVAPATTARAGSMLPLDKRKQLSNQPGHRVTGDRSPFVDALKALLQRAPLQALLR